MTQPRILINNISFHLPTGKSLFQDLTLALSQYKTGLVGRNGVGKSTLLKLILGELTPITGSIQTGGKLGFVPQNPILSQDITLAQFLECEEKINAFHRIIAGSVQEKDFTSLNEEWDIEERIKKWLGTFALSHIPYNRKITTLSGGETTRLFLTKIFLSDADFLLLDEPTNHLDERARESLYQAITEWQGGLIIVSHDRTLLNLMQEIVELTPLGANTYGGNYDDYVSQKEIKNAAHAQQLHNANKLMHKTQNTIKKVREKHQHKQSRGKELKRNNSIDKMGANFKKGRSEKTQNKLLIKEKRLLDHAESHLQSVKDKMEINEEIHVDLPATKVPNAKIILDIQDLNFSYGIDKNLIKNFSLKIIGPEKIAFVGDNGSGKTTLMKLILNELSPQSGKIYMGTEHVRYLDQNATLLNPNLSLLENFLQLNSDANENMAYRALAQFLFKNQTTHKLVGNLSGGEKLRALLACIFMSSYPPQLLILDEPTNHLDIANIKSIESALNHYQGAMIVISHDKTFLNNIGVTKVITAPFIV